jgi:hypothetical protein
MKNIKQKIKQESQELRKEFQQRTVSDVITAFGLVAAFAWNEAVKGLIEYIFPVSQNTILAKFIYAGIITVLVVIASVYLNRWLGEKTEK